MRGKGKLRGGEFGQIEDPKKDRKIRKDPVEGEADRLECLAVGDMGWDGMDGDRMEGWKGGW